MLNPNENPKHIRQVPWCLNNNTWSLSLRPYPPVKPIADINKYIMIVAIAYKMSMFSRNGPLHVTFPHAIPRLITT